MQTSGQVRLSGFLLWQAGDFQLYFYMPTGRAPGTSTFCERSGGGLDRDDLAGRDHIVITIE
ncbi:hypothetical protein P3102_35860 [Amycolatopsis sp. QT-25]|nr:hypothetical protein [Amycolatopsis sp. QT-25]WET83385.1 hypothetical protein P3102_35860 [Amycolatopsis sp. QT-25]